MSVSNDPLLYENHLKYLKPPFVRMITKTGSYLFITTLITYTKYFNVEVVNKSRKIFDFISTLSCCKYRVKRTEVNTVLILVDIISSREVSFQCTWLWSKAFYVSVISGEKIFLNVANVSRHTTAMWTVR